MTTPNPPPLIDLAIPRTGTSIVVDCKRCHLTVWACNTDRNGLCKKCRLLDLVTLVLAKDGK